MNLSEQWHIILAQTNLYYKQNTYSDLLKSHRSMPVDSQIARLLLEPLRDIFIAKLPNDREDIKNHFDTFIPVIVKTYRRYEKYCRRQPIKSCLFSREWAEELIIHYGGELNNLFSKKHLDRIIKSPTSH